MAMKRKATVAVTGLNTFIGREVVRRLLRAGESIVAIDVRRPKDLPEGATYYKVDLTLPTADAIVADIFARENVRRLVHLAFLSHPSRNAAFQHELQVIGTLHLLHAAAAQSLDKIVVKTNTMVYGAHPLNPNYLSEGSPVLGQPGYRWVQDLVEVEKLLDRYRRKHPQSRVISLRCAPILGPTVKNITSLQFERPAIVTLLGYDPLWQLLHEEDAVAATLRALDADQSGPFNVVGSGVLPLSSLIYLAGRLNLPVFHPMAFASVRMSWLAGLSAVPAEHLNYLRYLCVADGARAATDLGFNPTYSTRETLEQFAGVQRLRDVRLAA